jgi:hypothetical protein
MAKTMVPLATLECFISSLILTNETCDFVGFYTAVTDRNCLYSTTIHGAKYTDGWIADMYRYASVFSSPMIIIKTCKLSIGGDIQYPILVDGLVHVDICNTIAAGTNICYTSSAANVRTKYVVDSGAAKCRFRDNANYYFNFTTSIDGCMTATTATTPLLVPPIGLSALKLSDHWDGG